MVAEAGEDMGGRCSGALGAKGGTPLVANLSGSVAAARSPPTMGQIFAWPFVKKKWTLKEVWQGLLIRIHHTLSIWLGTHLPQASCQFLVLTIAIYIYNLIKV